MSEEYDRPRRALEHPLPEEIAPRPRRAMPADPGPVASDGPRHGLPDPVRPSREDGVRYRAVLGGFAAVLALAVGGLYAVYGVHEREDGRVVPEPSPSPASTSASPSPSPTTSPGTEETVGDTTITVPASWSLYHDERTEGDRRLIRVQDKAGQVRLQAATLTSVGPDLDKACQALVDGQRKEYAVDHLVLPRPMSVEGDAHGVHCGFAGTKKGQQAGTQVLFTLLQRTDGHTLVLRTMRADGVASDAAAMTDLGRMTCEASSRFGHPLPLC
ncbi:hypothetical protein [uncultured Tessaracoccus sp.]|uniref:hypothetical protein n=1 Tax=uncultured Tessaracoccus sp. TaxID=905023 RepID=UPI0025FB3CFD|nr:hypothetical protein [uncultured Tessaracoccus sp.]